MRADFSRFTYDPAKNFLLVLQQQGRVQLDADWNEQSLIFYSWLKQLTRDLLGWHAGPPGDFRIQVVEADGGHHLVIGQGRYYVEGLRCENPEDLPYADQPGGSMPTLESGKLYLAYLEVVERGVPAIKDDDIREKALNGPDTAARVQADWRVTVEEDDGQGTLGNWSSLDPPGPPGREDLESFLEVSQTGGRARLKARADPGGADQSSGLCEVPLEGGYRGLENQLYRVEVHTGGDSGTASFKWSRENGSVVFPVTDASDGTVTLEHLGRGGNRGLTPGDWVELTDDGRERQGTISNLLQVESIDEERFEVVLKDPNASSSSPLPVSNDLEDHPRLYRWDHTPTAASTDGARPVTESSEEDRGWIKLEDGIEIQFQPSAQLAEPTEYRTGEFWWIPARVATRGIEWPTRDGKPAPRRALRLERSYAPLAIIDFGGSTPYPIDLRRPIQHCLPHGHP